MELCTPQITKMASFFNEQRNQTERTSAAPWWIILDTRYKRVGLWCFCLDASFCIAQQRRTKFLCSEKEGTARGTRGRFFRCVGFTVTSQKSTIKRTHHTHTKERTPAVHLTLAYLTHSDRVPKVARGANARPGRSPKTNGGASARAALAPPFYTGCGDRARCQFPSLWKDRIRKI